MEGALAAELDAIRARSSDPSEILVPMLRAAERALGWLSDDALREVAERAGVDAEDAANIAAYFDMRRSQPIAADVFEVCVNVHCRRRGGEAILDRLRARLGLDVGETSPDARVSLQEIVCLKRCETGPALRHNGEIEDGLTPARVDEILGRLC
jgi:NADH-quinone oxidoreductase subunit E